MPFRLFVVWCTGFVCASALAAQGESSLLVTPRALAGELGSPGLVLLHVGPRPAYDAGHLPGARYVSPQDLAAEPRAGAPALELPDEAELRARLERLGIGDDSRVVVVPDADWGSQATRIIWTLQVAGLGARTRILEGGVGAWRRGGLPLTTEIPGAAPPGRLTLPSDRSLVVDHQWVRQRLGAPDLRLIDARAPVFFEGPGTTTGNGERREAGHIPSARNIPFTTLFSDSLVFLSREQLQRVFREAGVMPGETVVAYCHIGQQATVVLFAARLLGHPIKLYDGSFREWEALDLPRVNPGARPR